MLDRSADTTGRGGAPSERRAALSGRPSIAPARRPNQIRGMVDSGAIIALSVIDEEVYRCSTGIGIARSCVQESAWQAGTGLAVLIQLLSGTGNDIP